MPNLSPGAEAALPYWSIIEAAATEHWRTEVLWDALRSKAAEYGLASPGVTITGISQLRGIAGGIRARGQSVEAMPNSRPLAGRYWTQAPWARTLGEQRTAPMQQVRFQHTFIRNGETVTEWRTSIMEGKAPRTVGELRSRVQSDAINMSKKYGVEHVGIGALQLLVV